MSKEFRVNREEDPRIKLLYEKTAKIAACLPQGFFTGEETIDFPFDTTFFQIGKDRTGEHAREIPIQITGVNTKLVDTIELFEISFQELGDIEAYNYKVPIAITPEGKSLLRKHPSLIRDIFSLQQTQEQIQIDDFIDPILGAQENIYRISLSSEDEFILKNKPTREELDVLQIYSIINSISKKNGFSPEERKKQLINQSSQIEEIAVTAPTPFFASHRYLAMSELKGFSHASRFQDCDKIVVNKAKELLLLSGLNIMEDFEHWDAFIKREPKINLSTVAILDPHPTEIWFPW